MNSVSFGSTFRLKDDKHSAIRTMGTIGFCVNNNLSFVSKNEVVKPAKNCFEEPVYKVSQTIIAPDDKDDIVETYLANKGIKYKKLDTKSLFDKNKIEARIKDAPKDMKLVKVDVEKLDEFLSTQDNNIEHCEHDYDNYYKSSVDLMIKTGDKLPATTLHINPTGESVEDTVDYIKKFGADRLNDNQISLMFLQSTDDPDHCMYFGMKDLGMDEVPVYVNKDTYKIGNALGLFK